MTKQKIEIYTDGACLGNPGPGGWGAILLHNDRQKKLAGGEDDTTNNRMEIMAIIQALKAVNGSLHITLYTDSKYVIDGITKWIHGWKKNGWRNANRKPVKNSDLWQELDELHSMHTIEWQWVKGHSGNYYNEIVDDLARLEAQAVQAKKS